MSERHADRPRRSGCPVSFALDILGDKWTLLVLRDAVFLGKRTFGEFLSSGEGISTNILADRLQRLESAGILLKNSLPESPGRPWYTITDKGAELLPVLVDLIVWGAKHDPQTEAPPEFVKRATEEREALLNEIAVGLKNRHGNA